MDALFRACGRYSIRSPQASRSMLAVPAWQQDRDC